MTSHFFLTSPAPAPFNPLCVDASFDALSGEVFIDDEQLPVASDWFDSAVVWYCFSDDHRRLRFDLTFLSRSKALASIGSLTLCCCCFWWKEKRLFIRRFGGVDWVSDEKERRRENEDMAARNIWQLAFVLLFPLEATIILTCPRDETNSKWKRILIKSLEILIRDLLSKQAKQMKGKWNKKKCECIVFWFNLAFRVGGVGGGELRSILKQRAVVMRVVDCDEIRGNYIKGASELGECQMIIVVI